MMTEKYIPLFFEYDEGIVKININEYEYPKSQFNLKDENELKEFIRTIDILYNKCDDERIMNNTDANAEYYLRDDIVCKIREYQCRYESDIIDKLVEDVDNILE